MIVAGFTGQLRGWWDNYLSVDERAMVINAKATEDGIDNLGMALVANREDAVYTLILTILEHFNGRFTNQNETLYPPIILGTPFINAIYPFTSIDSKGFTATYKDKEISYTFVTDPEKIKLISEQIAIDICAEHPSTFWNRKKHIVTLPYEDNFSKNDIPTKSRPCQMNAELVEFCKKEIDSLLSKGLIKPSKSPWSCTVFYVNNAAEKECGWNPPGVGEEVEVGEDRPHSPEEGHHLRDRHTDPHQTPQLYKWEEGV
ncbi:uncharacterized protein [Nicotiana tomentosiformis]|uniref:uncharacterized protein n=1 Tax=Nicotiana tomentosiformis TaxID=4098 RepID=UPI00388CCC60